MIRAVLASLLIAASAQVVSAQQPTPVPPPRPVVEMPPEPAPMGQPIYLYPTYPAPGYAYHPYLGYYPYSGTGTYWYGYPPVAGFGPIPAPWPGSAMLYPYPRTVSSYSFGPTAYPANYGGGWGWGGGCCW